MATRARLRADELLPAQELATARAPTTPSASSAPNGDDHINGRGGDDFLEGAGGNDDLDGGRGRDSLFGRTGDDRLDGGLGGDEIEGGRGDDTIIGGDGSRRDQRRPRARPHRRRPRQRHHPRGRRRHRRHRLRPRPRPRREGQPRPHAQLRDRALTRRDAPAGGGSCRLKALPGDSTRQVPLPARPPFDRCGGVPLPAGPPAFDAGAAYHRGSMGIELTELEPLVRRALDEDVGSGDLTTQATVPPGARARARITQKQPGVALRARRRASSRSRLLDPGARFLALADEGVWRERRAGARHRGRGGRAAQRRAHRAEPAAAPERAWRR